MNATATDTIVANIPIKHKAPWAFIKLDLIGFNSLIKYQKSKYYVIKVNTDKNNLKQSIKIIRDKVEI